MIFKNEEYLGMEKITIIVMEEITINECDIPSKNHIQLKNN